DAYIRTSSRATSLFPDPARRSRLWLIGQKGVCALKYIALIAVAFVALSVPARADFREGYAAYQSGDYPAAAREFAALANEGDARAQFNLGVMYDKGEGVPQDYAEAAKWFRKAAEQGLAVAQTNLGVYFQRGKGVAQDYEKAAEWYRKAAEQDYATAQYNLGVLFEIGKGVAQSDVDAAEWYRKAAEQDNATAQYNLGALFQRGKGVPQDDVKAHMWFNLAAAKLLRGDARAKAVRNRRLTAERMTPEQIAVAQKLALEWHAQHRE
ncbi:MAG: tetratricopeptide repeat protein, partial [Alphaproteobacteria bacterium]